MDISETLAALRKKTLIFTVTSGRSGTKLLATLLKNALGIEAEHEAAPRVNFVLRSLISAPEVGTSWLAHEKLPAILARAQGPIYVETSHLFCKALIEPILDLGLRPKFIILTRPAREIARSLFEINAIPERTGAGRLVLLGPSDPGVLRLPNWERFSDYQLCYWYAREIERRQVYYEALFAKRELGFFRMTMRALTDWDSFRALAKFVSGKEGFLPREGVFRRIVAENQNPRSAVSDPAQVRALPANVAEEENALDAALAGYVDTDRD